MEPTHDNFGFWTGFRGLGRPGVPGSVRNVVPTGLRDVPSVFLAEWAALGYPDTIPARSRCGFPQNSTEILCADLMLAYRTS